MQQITFDNEEFTDILESQPPTQPTDPTPNDLDEDIEPQVSDDTDYTPYYEVLKDLNVLSLPDDFEFDGKVETLQKAFDITRETLQEEVSTELWNSLPSNFKPLLEYALEGGTDLEKFLSAHAKDYSKIDLTSEDTQIEIMREFYSKTTSYGPEKINKFISRLQDTGDLAEEAKTSLTDLQQMQVEERDNLLKQTKTQRAAAEKNQREFVDKLSQTIEKTFPDKPKQSKIRAFFFNPIQYKDGTASTEFETVINVIRSTPEHLVQLADFLTAYDPKKGFDFTRYQTQGRSQANSAFKKLIEDKLDPKSKIKGSLPADPSKFDYEEFYKHL